MSWPGWTTETSTLLLELRRKGRTFGQCADEIGCTRNAAIGRATVLRASGGGMRSGTRPKRPKQPPKFFGRDREPPRDRAAPLAPVMQRMQMEPSAVTNRVLMDLRTGDCRWPVGEFHDRARFFCGDAVTSSRYDAPYCAKHHARAYQPAARKQG